MVRRRDPPQQGRLRQRPQVGDRRPGVAVRIGAVAPPGRGRSLATLTIVVELGAPVVLLARRWATAAWVGAAWGFHVGILALMAIAFPYQLTLVAFAPLLPVERLPAPTPPVIERLLLAARPARRRRDRRRRRPAPNDDHGGADPHRAPTCPTSSTGPTSPGPTPTWLVVAFSSADVPVVPRARGRRWPPLESAAVAVEDVAYQERRDLHDRYGIDAVPRRARRRRRGRRAGELRRPAVGRRPVGGLADAPRARRRCPRLRHHDSADPASGAGRSPALTRAGAGRSVPPLAAAVGAAVTRSRSPNSSAACVPLAAELDEALDLGAVDRLVLEQRAGHEVEAVAVLGRAGSRHRSSCSRRIRSTSSSITRAVSSE